MMISLYVCSHTGDTYDNDNNDDIFRNNDDFDNDNDDNDDNNDFDKNNDDNSCNCCAFAMNLVCICKPVCLQPYTPFNGE